MKGLSIRCSQIASFFYFSVHLERSQWLCLSFIKIEVHNPYTLPDPAKRHSHNRVRGLSLHFGTYPKISPSCNIVERFLFAQCITACVKCWVSSPFDALGNMITQGNRLSCLLLASLILVLGEVLTLPQKNSVKRRYNQDH